MDAPRSLRAHGLRIGALEPGATSSIADVAGVRVGQVTVIRDESDPPAGRGVARTGVTAIVPAAPVTLFSEPLTAGVAVLNGAGEMTGAVQISEWGLLETPVYLTATMSVGRVFDGAAQDVAQGAVGAGAGMVCFGFKGGIGTASRLVPSLGAVVGTLVLANFGAG